MGILTVGVVTKPFQFEGARRMRLADGGIEELHKAVDTLIVIPNQNLFRVANEKTTFADAFSMADQVLYSGVACITDLMVREGLINLDFADVRAIMRDMGKAMMGTGEASGERRAILAAEAAIANPLLDEVSMKGAKGLLISITGGNDLTLYEVDEAASRIRQEVDEDANIILGATFDGASTASSASPSSPPASTSRPDVVDMNDQRLIEAGERMRAQAAARQAETALPLRPAAPAPAARTESYYAAVPAPQPAAAPAAEIRTCSGPGAAPAYVPQAASGARAAGLCPAAAARLRAASGRRPYQARPADAAVLSGAGARSSPPRRGARAAAASFRRRRSSRSARSACRRSTNSRLPGQDLMRSPRRRPRRRAGRKPAAARCWSGWPLSA